MTDADPNPREYFEFKPLPNGFRPRPCDACKRPATHHSIAARRASGGKAGFVCHEHAVTIPALLNAFESMAAELSEADGEENDGQEK